MNRYPGIARRVLLACPLLLLAVGPGASAPAEVGKVARLVGRVSVATAGAASADARPGMKLHEGDRIVTGPGGRVEVVAEDGTTLAIGERTTVTLTRFARPRGAGGGHGLLDLIEGILRIGLPLSWDRFEVTTGTAVASVRSTDWVIEAKPDDTAVFVVKGRVQVVNRAGTGGVLLDPGFGTDVRPGALPTTPKRWGQARVDAALARTRVP